MLQYCKNTLLQVVGCSCWLQLYCGHTAGSLGSEQLHADAAWMYTRYKKHSHPACMCQMIILDLYMPSVHACLVLCACLNGSQVYNDDKC